MHFLRTILSQRLTHMGSVLMFIMMKVTRRTLWFTDAFVIAFGQQWKSIPQRNKLYQALTTQLILRASQLLVLVYKDLLMINKKYHQL